MLDYGTGCTHEPSQNGTVLALHDIRVAATQDDAMCTVQHLMAPTADDGIIFCVCIIRNYIMKLRRKSQERRVETIQKATATADTLSKKERIKRRIREII
jgi:hypothetical protein